MYFYPLVVKDGAGERGNDNEKQLTHGGQMFLNPVNQEKYPAFVLIPQCPTDGYWAYTERPKSFIPAEMPVGQEISPILQTLKQLLDSYLRYSQSKPVVGCQRCEVPYLSWRCG